MGVHRGAIGAMLLALTVATTAAAQLPAQAPVQAPVTYRLTFPEPEHRWMQVEVLLTELPTAPLDLHMSRASPGRYALHDFAKNVYDVRITDTAGSALVVARPTPHRWEVARHPSAVRVSYRVFGDRTDGTYLSIDSTHAHINMPSALMWARGLEERPVSVTFEPPAASAWKVATQLFPSQDARTFTAPNLQYLMDSPSEFSGFSLRTFSVRDGARTPTFRLAIHHEGDEAELDGLARDAEKIVRQERGVYREFPAYDSGTYTFIADYLPWADGDGMEHRNSTIVTLDGSARANRASVLSTMAHEFFHSWNVERIRPKSLEPFNFDDMNMSGELWLAEGFTNYYGPLALQRAGLTDLASFAGTLGRAIDTVTVSPGRRLRTAEEMSQMAPFVDAATSNDRTNVDNAFISYYTWGEVIALGLDLTLRERSGGTVSLDDFMRAMWERFGKPGGRAPGYVDRPYTMGDARAVLAAVAGDAAFADDFFARFIQGHEVVDYERLLSNAGLVIRRRSPTAGFVGDLQLEEAPNGVRITGAVPSESPAYAAGLERDDVIASVGSMTATRVEDVAAAVREARPGVGLSVTFLRRNQRVTATLRVVADPRIEVVPAEQAGQRLTDAQRRFRDAWLESRAGL